jgi:hypothetical protein
MVGPAILAATFLSLGAQRIENQVRSRSKNIFLVGSRDDGLLFGFSLVVRNNHKVQRGLPRGGKCGIASEGHVIVDKSGHSSI